MKSNSQHCYLMGDTSPVITAACEALLIGSMAVAPSPDWQYMGCVMPECGARVQSMPSYQQARIMMTLSSNEMQKERLAEERSAFLEVELSDSSVRARFEKSCELAYLFISLLPEGLCSADVDVDADGYVNLEWYRSSAYQMSVTFSESHLHCIHVYDGASMPETLSIDEAAKAIKWVSDIVYA